MIALGSVVLSVTPAMAHAADVLEPTATTAPAAAKLTVQVLGRVKQPGTVRLETGARLSDALTAAGAQFDTLVALGPGPLVRDTDCMLGGSSLQYVFLTRTTETSKNMSYMIDISNMLRHHDLRYDPLLRDDDKIVVPECRPQGRMIATPPTFPKSEA
ncbi:MAG TPA: SLBB domain-containing protein [Candidatus Elarobacter sp.]